MALKLMYITNNADVALIAENMEWTGSGLI